VDDMSQDPEFEPQEEEESSVPDSAKALDDDRNGSGEAGAEEAAPGAQAEWFVIHSYSGMENKVKRNLEHRAESMGMTDRILQVVVPTETEIEIKDGVRREVERRVFPGYVLIKMIMDEDSWYVVRNTPGVTSFVGTGNRPTPLSGEEVEKIMSRIESDEPRVKVSFQSGERVRITSGPFAEFTGVVDEIDLDKGKAKVMVSFFNRETPVEVDFLQLERE
jgi:transcription termination/antitermination protein NusG